jgi:hypothetical protein
MIKERRSQDRTPLWKQERGMFQDSRGCSAMPPVSCAERTKETDTGNLTWS